MNISFYLQNPKADETQIMLYATFESKRLRISSGQKIPIKYWDNRKQRVKRGYSLSSEINAWLEKLSQEIHRIYIEAKSLGVKIDPKYVKSKVNEFRFPVQNRTIPNQESFFKEFDKFIDKRKNNTAYRHGTIQNYQTAYNHIKKFSTKRKYQISFETIDDNFYDKFTDYLFTDKGLTNNTVGAIIKVLKNFLNYSVKNKLTKNIAYQDFRICRSEASHIALTLEELKDIENLDLEEQHLKEARDLFLLQCYTGVRISDLLNLKPENFDLVSEQIRIYSIKTRTLLTIPIHRKIKSIIDRYPDLQLPRMHSSRYNKKIKQIARKAGIIEEVEITRYKGSNRIDEYKQKCELVTSHTARRTFITISLKKNVLPELVMKVSGHKDRKSFQKYVKVTQNEAISAIKNAWD